MSTLRIPCWEKLFPTRRIQRLLNSLGIGKYAQRTAAPLGMSGGIDNAYFDQAKFNERMYTPETARVHAQPDYGGAYQDQGVPPDYDGVLSWDCERPYWDVLRWAKNYGAPTIERVVSAMEESSSACRAYAPRCTLLSFDLMILGWPDNPGRPWEERLSFAFDGNAIDTYLHSTQDRPWYDRILKRNLEWKAEHGGQVFVAVWHKYRDRPHSSVNKSYLLPEDVARGHLRWALDTVHAGQTIDGILWFSTGWGDHDEADYEWFAELLAEEIQR